MTRPLRSRAEQPQLLGQADMLALIGFSQHVWLDLQANDRDRTLPQPVNLPGRPRYRRADVLRWIEELGTRD